MRKTIKIVIYSILSLLLVFMVFLGIIYHQVSEEASTRVERGVIDRIILSESPVYYDDGKTPMGVYFQKIHRKYIHYRAVPTLFIKALVASEDRNFFSHPGFDIKAIIRAFIANIKAGKIVQGGSTLTQQTAKNIFKRQKRTYTAKFRELIQALLLEKSYTKEEIIEIYINQFFVTGFGKGLKIAAEYFFGKNAEDLDLVESAFIAGSVKGPNRYNPFTKKTEAEKQEAMRRAKIRKNYVLKNMLLMKYVTQEQYLKAAEREVPFKEGKVTYRLNVILDYIREQLESDYFRNIMRQQGIENIATSGVSIYTSIDKEIQDGSLKSIRRHLPLLDVKLSGYDANLLQERYSELSVEIPDRPKDNLLFLGRITSINSTIRNPSLIVAWDKGGGIIEYEGLKDMGEAWLKWKLGEWALFDRRHVPDFLKEFNIGDLVPVQYMETQGKDGKRRLTLSKIPELEGGIIVLHKGRVKAMVGGFFNRFFNRAAFAKRQLGSIFKPIVYTAALQLKWNTLDPLLNMRDVYRFENTFYLPKPDHIPKSRKVSMTWAGVKSENLATVWLLYHLTDRLNMGEFRHVMKLLGLDQKSNESYGEYMKRIRDVHGVVVNRKALMEAAFEESKKEIESDIIFSGLEDALDNLNRLHFELDTNKLNLEDYNQDEISRLNFLGLGYQRLRSLNFEMKRGFEKIRHLSDLYAKKEDPDLREELSEALRYFYLADQETHGPRIIYSEDPDRLNFPNVYQITPELVLERIERIDIKEIWIDGLIPSEVLDLLQSNMKKIYKRFLDHKRYDVEILYRVRDFRTLVNLFYVKQLANEMGIYTRLDPVLSFPLGPNSISILEAGISYHTIMSGHLSHTKDRMTSSMIPIITKIVDREGETIWEYKPQSKKILTRKVSGAVIEILRMSIENGTGRNAKDAVRLSVGFESGTFDIPIPSFGKTGTANRYTNSSFVGFIPGLTEDRGEFDIQEGYVISSYVGYDDNRPLKGNHVTIYGASGALPLWIDVANSIVNSKEYKKKLQIADLAFGTQSLGRLRHEGLRPVTVSSISGLRELGKEEKRPEKHLQLFSNVDIIEDRLILRRVFEPLQGAYGAEKTGN
jgi:membrane peptidoglycan carboxypeptidase